MSRLNAAYYPMARTAHLERLGDSGADVIYYTKHRADWDLSVLNDPSTAIRTGVWGVARAVLSGSLKTLEVPEPLAIRLLPQLLAVSGAVRMTPRRRRPRVSTYAIENLDQVDKLAIALRSRTLSQLCLRVALAGVTPMLDRVAFGTDGARATYVDNYGQRGWRRLRRSAAVKTFEALPQPETSASNDLPRRSLVFLGTFEDRKGYWALIRCWDQVRAALPGATLQIIGKGTPKDEASSVEWAASRPEVDLELNPPRHHIHELLDDAAVLVMASRRTPTWREQVGLPILEALSHGLTIVTSEETGIARWLSGHGHQVVGSDYSDEELTSALIEAIKAPLPRADVLASLPDVDQRRAADAWMFASADERTSVSPL